MRRIVELSVSLCLLSGLLMAEGPGKRLTFEQAFQSRGEPLLKKLPLTIGWLDSQRYLETRDGQLVVVTARSGKAGPFLAPAAMSTLTEADLDPLTADDRSADWSTFLFHRDRELLVFSRASGQLDRVSLPVGEPQNPTLSPDGRRAAFTVAGDLYVTDLTAATTQRLTRDGSEKILNGYASWVYYEEILGRQSKYRAFWWSPQGDQLVFLRFDQSKVPVFPLFQVTGDYGQLENQRYPKAGYPNPSVKLGVWATERPEVRWIDLGAREDDYVAFPVWAPDGRSFYVQKMNRAQDTLQVLACSAAGGTPRQVYEERQLSWVEFMDDGKFVPLKRGGFLALSDQSGYCHLILVDAAGREKTLTSGEWAVQDIVEVDEASGRVFFTAHRDVSTQTGLYCLLLAGGAPVRLTAPGGTHSPQVAPGGTYFIDRWSKVDRPPVMELFSGAGKRVRLLGDSDSPVRREYRLGKEEIFRIPTADGFQLPARWCLPPDLDPGKKYPLVLEVYGGPGAPEVSDSFNCRWIDGRGAVVRWDARYMAGQGIIVLALDHRGSGHFGKRGKALMHRRLGYWEMKDYTEAIRELIARHPFIDATRIGITGGSYGGYVAALAVIKEGDLFRCGIADFGVMDWRLYDSVYTERFMDTPEENPDGYREGSVLNWIDRYRGGLRIIHGTMDDNVHMQNSLQLLDALLSAGKTAEFMLYPGQRHGIRGPKSVEYNRSAMEFWQRRFFGSSAGDQG